MALEWGLTRSRCASRRLLCILCVLRMDTTAEWMPFMSSQVFSFQLQCKFQPSSVMSRAGVYEDSYPRCQRCSDNVIRLPKEIINDCPRQLLPGQNLLWFSGRSRFVALCCDFWFLSRKPAEGKAGVGILTPTRSSAGRFKDLASNFSSSLLLREG